MTAEHGGFLPTPDEMLVLRACMHEPQKALAAWKKWRGQYALSHLNVAQKNLLPLVYHNLHAAGYTEPEDMAFLEDAYQESRNRIQALWHSLGQVLHAFHDRGISPLLLKGMALGVLCYPDRYTRRMADIDVIVPLAQVEQSIEVMRDAGWGCDEPLETWSRCNFNACTFRNAQNRMLDMHWHLFSGARDDDDAILWKRAESLNTEVGEIRTLSVSDHLFHCCIHGYAWSPLHPMRWIVDAHMLLRHAQGSIDWQYIIEQARARQLTLRLLNALKILQGAEVLAVPDSAIHALRSIPVSRWEQAEHDFITSPLPSHPTVGQEKLRLLRMAWFKHRRYRRDSSLLSCMWTYPAMLSEEMCLGRVWLLPWGFVRVVARMLHGKYARLMARNP